MKFDKKLPFRYFFCKNLMRYTIPMTIEGGSVQAASYLEANNLMPRNQSAYRRNRSTESTLTILFSDIMSAIDNGNFVLLLLLDLSAAFDCVDHEF